VKYLLLAVLCVLAFVTFNWSEKLHIDPCNLDNHSPTDWIFLDSGADTSLDAPSLKEAEHDLTRSGVCVLNIDSSIATTFAIIYRAEIPLSQVPAGVRHGWHHTPINLVIENLEEAREFLEGEVPAYRAEIKTEQSKLNATENDEATRNKLELGISTKKIMLQELLVELEEVKSKIQFYKNHETQ